MYPSAVCLYGLITSISSHCQLHRKVMVRHDPISQSHAASLPLLLPLIDLQSSINRVKQESEYCDGTELPQVAQVDANSSEKWHDGSALLAERHR